MKNRAVSADFSSSDKIHQELCQDKPAGICHENDARDLAILRYLIYSLSQDVANIVLPDNIQ